MEIEELYLDSLKELINIGVGKGAEVLNTMLQSHISLSVPGIEIVSARDIKERALSSFDGVLATVNLGYSGSFSGNTKLVFSLDSAKKLVSALTGMEADDDNDEMDEIQAGTLVEVGNIIVNAVMGSISNVLHLNFLYTVPVFASGNYEELFVEELVKDDEIFLIAKTKFVVEELDLQGDIVLSFALKSFEQIKLEIDKYITELTG